MIPALHRELSLLRVEELHTTAALERRAARLDRRPSSRVRLGHRLVAVGNRLIGSRCDGLVAREVV